MRTARRGIEATYQATGDVEVPSLVELFGSLRGKPGAPASDGTPWAEGEPVGHSFDSTYFDTAQLDLSAAGLTLLRRAGGDDAGWHLEVPVPGSAPRVVRVPLEEGAEDVPKQLVSMTRAGAWGRPLIPVARIHTDRAVRRLVDPTGQVLVEVADDRVTGQRIAGVAGQDEAPAEMTTWRAIEVEVVHGPPRLLTDVDAPLRERGLTPAPAVSPVVRMLGAEALVAARRSPGRSSATGSVDGTAGAGKSKARRSATGKVRSPEKTSAGDVVLEYIATQVGQVHAQDLPVRLDLPGAVHAMRVASRRLRSALTTFEPLFHGTVTRPVGRELRWLAGVLGAARDAEVMRARVGTALLDQRDDVRPGTAGDAQVSADLDDAYRTAHDAVLRELDGERYGDLLAVLEGLVEHPPFKDRAGRPARDVLPGLVSRSYTALRWSMVAANGSSDPVEREQLQHDARKAAKRARYAAESVASVFGKDARTLAAAMEHVQETLGEHLETATTRRRLQDLAHRTSDPGTAFALGRRDAFEEVQGERSAVEVDAAWAAASRKRLRRWLR